MGFWGDVAKWGATAVGAVGGFAVGGPAGAVAGGSLGYGLGAALDGAIDGKEGEGAAPSVASAGAVGRPRKAVPPPPEHPGPYYEPTNSTEASRNSGGRAAYDKAIAEYNTKKAAWDKLAYEAEHPYEIAAPDAKAGAYGPTGDPDYARKQSRHIELDRQAAEKRRGYTFDLAETNRDALASYAAREQGQAARGLQLDAYGQYADVLSGKAPSLAELQMRQGLSDTQMAAQNMAVSARGGGGNQLLAMREAQRQGALGAQRVNAESAMLRAREMEMARSGLIGAASQIRNQDFQVRNQDLQSRGMSFDQQQGMADAYYRNRQANDQYGLGLLGAQAQVDQSATNARMSYEQMLQHGRMGTMQATQGVDVAEMGANAGMAQSQMQAQNQANLAYYAQQQENARANERMVATGLTAAASMYGAKH